MAFYGTGGGGGHASAAADLSHASRGACGASLAQRVYTQLSTAPTITSETDC